MIRKVNKQNNFSSATTLVTDISTTMYSSVFLAILICFLYPNTAQDVKDIKQVHLIFMNHLDVGFDGIHPEIGFINNILNKYFHVYYPRAIQRANELRVMGYEERIIYTTHAWLVSMYLNCPPNMVLAGVKLKCPDATDIKAFNSAVSLGDIVWHAGPMNMQNEIMHPAVVDFSLKIAEDLDKHYGIKRPAKTLSQRDVPGMSQGLLPIFNKHGIQAITVGVNAATAPPAVPKIFNWKYHNTSLIAMWHPGGYPNTPGHFPNVPGGLSADDCVTFPGFDQALCFAFRNDNQGPPESMQEILLYYDIARSQFPGAVVQSSTFDEFVALAVSIKDKLPVVEQELGDVWIQGVSSDPLKVAKMRAFYRKWANCVDKGQCSLDDPKVYNSSRFLVKLGEHTWGIDNVFDNTNWTNSQFYKYLHLNITNYANGINSWIEQRAFLDLALEALGNHSLADQVRMEWKQILSTPPVYKDFEKVPDSLNVLKCDDGFEFEFSDHGYLTTLVDPTTKINWASKSHPMGQFLYQTYNQSDFDALDSESVPYSKHFFLGIGKPNISKNAAAESKIWPTKLIQRYRKNNNNQCDFLIHLQLEDDKSISYYGAPRDIWIRYTQPKNTNYLNVEIQWYNKPATRMPEAIFYSFKPTIQSDYKWKLHKLGSVIDPLNVVMNGSQRLHAVDEQGFYYSKLKRGLQITSLDVALVTVMTSEYGASGLPIPLSPIKDVTGMAYNLFNNLWNVNYIFWYPFLQEDQNQKFRFRMNFGDLSE